jgi:hypothetical protein
MVAGIEPRLGYLFRIQFKTFEIASLPPFGAGVDSALVNQNINGMKPRDFASHLVFMRAYQFIQLIDCDTFRMLTHQAEDRLNGTILLGEFATISHDFSFSPPFYLALPGRVIQGLELSTKLSDTTACARSATMRTARLAEPGKPVLQLLGPPANRDGIFSNFPGRAYQIVFKPLKRQARNDRSRCCSQYIVTECDLFARGLQRGVGFFPIQSRVLIFVPQ